MTKGEFDKLSEKYLSDKMTTDEQKLLEKWAQFHSDADYDIFQDETEYRQTSRRLWHRIASHTGLPTAAKPLWQRASLWTGLAASVLIAVFTYFYVPSNQDKPALVHGIETTNAAPSRQLTILPDGTTVILEKNASIVIDADYGKKNRTVFLSGEAFFNVKRNTQKPFLIHSGELATEVLGTSFRIKPQPNNRTIEVIVKTGSVSVYTTNKNDHSKLDGVVVTPNQKAIYDAVAKTITSYIVDNPELVAASKAAPDFHFEEIPAEDVFTAISKAYGIEILVANESIKECAFTGNLTGMSLFNQLSAICDVIGAEYEIRGTTVFISGQGCQER